MLISQCVEHLVGKYVSPYQKMHIFITLFGLIVCKILIATADVYQLKEAYIIPSRIVRQDVDQSIH